MANRIAISTRATYTLRWSRTDGRTTRNQRLTPANKYGNDPYDTGIGVENYLALIEPVEEIETSADLANVIADQIGDYLKYIPEKDLFFGWNEKYLRKTLDGFCVTRYGCLALTVTTAPV